MARKKRKSLSREDALEIIVELLEGYVEIMDFKPASFRPEPKFLKENTVEAKNREQFKKAIKDKKLVFGFFCHSQECEETIKEETTATSRLLVPSTNKGKCMYCSKAAKEKAYFGKNY